MLRYRLRTLLIALAVLPPFLAGAWWFAWPPVKSEIDSAYNSWLWRREIVELEAELRLQDVIREARERSLSSPRGSSRLELTPEQPER